MHTGLDWTTYVCMLTFLNVLEEWFNFSAIRIHTGHTYVVLDVFDSEPWILGPILTESAP